MSDLDGYDPDDPKSPDWFDRIADRADNQRHEIEPPPNLWGASQ
jgi:hypothetical protein